MGVVFSVVTFIVISLRVWDRILCQDRSQTGLFFVLLYHLWSWSYSWSYTFG